VKVEIDDSILFERGKTTRSQFSSAQGGKGTIQLPNGAARCCTILQKSAFGSFFLFDGAQENGTCARWGRFPSFEKQALVKGGC